MTSTLEPIMGSLIEDAPTKEFQDHTRAMMGRGYVTIVSIYPGLLEYRSRHYGLPVYTLKPPPRGGYSGLRVYDTEEWMNRPDPTDGKPTWLPGPIPARVVANALVQIWARSSLGNKSGFAPGVGIIEGDEPTTTELKALRDMQNKLFNWYILDANGKHLKGEATEINEIHRMAAKEMLDKGAEKLPWYPTVAFTEVKDCIACGKQIETRALVCPECKTDLPARYLQYNLDTAADPMVAAFIAKMNFGKGHSKGKDN
ncbi:MAG TPA: hypothetical protein VNZ86_13620 [Bacteroidia bacterium]|jgi:hypothetical protein|nr:hypothetical protein [Bacteroidia bacterium]